jgi:pimeloyl-ACP methyl ester carboxylesterase
VSVFHFGDPASPLAGVLHLPPARAATGVLLCPPLLGELVQGYRVLRHVAERLAQAGLPVLRFDYLGTGDSAGDGEAITDASLTDDARSALDELLDATGARHAVVLGVRLGAMAGQPLTADPRVRGCVWWDPVTDGAALVRDWRRRGTPDRAGMLWVDGMPASAPLCDAVSRWRGVANATSCVHTPAAWGAPGPDGWLQVPGQALTEVVATVVAAAHGSPS